MKVCVSVIVACLVFCSCAHAEDERLGRDDFVSTAIADVFDKVGKYTSGEKTFFDRDEKSDQSASSGSTDPLGRPIPDPAIKPLKRPES